MIASNALLLALAHPSSGHARTTSLSIWQRWDLDPILLTAIILPMTIYAIGIRRLWRSAGRGKGISVGQAACFGLAWLALIAALVSPLDALSDELASAHMLQHELLMVVAAPLVALSSPFVAFLWAFRSRPAPVAGVLGASRALEVVCAPAIVWLLHALALWIWHMPTLYDAALEHQWIHVLQHVCFFGTAAMFWWGMLHGRYGRLGYGAAVVYVFVTAMQSGVLGALLTMAPTPWYSPYSASTAAWGLTALEDQQLAGLIMWVPSSLVFLVVGLGFLAAWLKESERRTRALPSLVVLIAVVWSSSCGQSPAIPYVRAVDGAASWVAAVRYAHQLTSGEIVPDRYFDVLLKDGVTELQATRKRIAGMTDVPARVREQAEALCDDVASTLRAAEADPRALDVARLGQQESALRTLSKSMSPQ